MKTRKAVMAVSLAAFFLVMLFPIWGLVLPQPAEEGLEENRNMTEWSMEGSLKDIISTTEEYLNDHLAFRRTAIAATLRANLALGESPYPLVIPGTDGWLFYNEGEEDFRNGDGVSEEMLGALMWEQEAAARKFAAAGVDYRILIAPDKHTIYPQYLPISNRMGSGVCETDQIMAAAGEDSAVRFVDVRPALIQAAEGDLQQYYKLDTHWNPNGAYTAYQALVDALIEEHPTIHRLGEDEVGLAPMTLSGDLAAMVGQKGIMSETFDAVYVKHLPIHEDPERSGDGFTVIVNDELPDAPRIMLLHDSFGDAIAPFLEASFSEVWLANNESLSFEGFGDLSRFDIVIYEVVERNRSWLWDGITGADDEEWEEEEEGY